VPRANGKGDGSLADELKVRPADLTEIATRRGGKFPAVEVREIIDGRRKGAAFQVLLPRKRSRATIYG
jgi:hypothetical protein